MVTKKFINIRTYSYMTMKGWKNTSEVVPPYGTVYKEWTSKVQPANVVYIVRAVNEGHVSRQGARYFYKIYHVNNGLVENEYGPFCSGKQARDVARFVMSTLNERFSQTPGEAE